MFPSNYNYAHFGILDKKEAYKMRINSKLIRKHARILHYHIIRTYTCSDQIFCLFGFSHHFFNVANIRV